MQTSYSTDPVAGFPGQISSGYPHAVETRLAQTALFFGLYAVAGDPVPGSTEKYAKHPTGSFQPEDALGIVHLDPSVVMPQGFTEETPPYPAKCQAGIVRKGRVWARIDGERPVPDSPVYVRTTAAPGRPAGGLRASAEETVDSLEVTVVTAADAAVLELVVNGVSLTWTSGATQTAAQKATAFAAHVDAISGFSASASGAVVTITTDSGAIDVEEHSEASVFTYEITSEAGPTVAVELPGAFWRQVPDSQIGEIEFA